MKTPQTKIVRIFCGRDFTQEDRVNLSLLFRHLAPEVQLVFNRSGICDLAVVLNYDPRPHWVVVPDGSLIKWLLEPRVDKNLSRRFSHKHDKKFSEIYVPILSEDRREHLSPPLYPPRISSPLLEKIVIGSLSAPKGERLPVSIIASTLDHLEGHKFRSEIVSLIENESPGSVHIYGRGRVPISRKEDGILPYRFTIVVENSFQGAYWTEKVTDAFLCETVPIYVGSRQLAEYFPRESFIDCSGYSPSEVLSLAQSLTEDDYIMRLPAVRRAKALVIEKHNLASELASILNQQGTNPRLALTVDSNSLVHWALKLATPMLSTLARSRDSLKLRGKKSPST